jgi:hypothetical protein
VKKLIFGSLFCTGLLFSAQESKATTNNGSKSQAETSTKSLEAGKYNFTLFNFFNTSSKTKVDSTRTVNYYRSETHKREE